MKKRWKKRWKKRRIKKTAYSLLAVFFVLLTVIFTDCIRSDSLMQMIFSQAKSEIYLHMLNTTVPALFYEKTEKNGIRYLVEKVFLTIPVYGYVTNTQEYTTQSESDISYEEIIRQEAADETYVEEQTGEMLAQEQPAAGTENAGTETAGTETTENEIADAGNSPSTDETKESGEAAKKPEGVEVASSGFVPNQTPVVSYAQDKLNDFDYLIQNFYVVDRTTTINSTQLNAADLLSRSMKLTHGADSPQILIYHTHSQERFADSLAGDTSASIVGVGAYLHQLLGKYGFHVLHDTGEYDVESRDDAYSKAGPALEKILKENPGIEVVIDLHRDGVAENTRLVTEVGGKQMASIMFFNGLSRTTANGDIGYLYNPYIQDNLAFSLQMQITAEEYYPGFSRAIYLKGYRYNMHYCPKTLLVEVGAQTNTVEEAMNAMEPLADILAKVLGQ